MKELITANTISDARKAGVQHLYVSPGALITPQAKDDAKEYGIALIMQDKPVAPVMAAPTYTVAAPSVAHVTTQGTFPAYAATQQHRVVMNTPNSPTPAMDPMMQQLVEQVLKAVAPTQAPMQVPVQAPAAPSYGQAQSIDAAAVAAQVVQQINGLLATRGGIAAFPGMESTIASLVAEYTKPATTQHVMAAPAPMAAPMSAPAMPYAACAQGNVAGIDVVPFTSQQPAGRVQGEVNIEEALLPGQNGPGVTRFTFTDTSLVWTFTHQEVLVVTHGSIEVQGPNSTCMLTQGSAIRVAKGTSVTLVAHGAASCVCTAWPQ